MVLTAQVILAALGATLTLALTDPNQYKVIGLEKYGAEGKTPSVDVEVVD